MTKRFFTFIAFAILLVTTATLPVLAAEDPFVSADWKAILSRVPGELLGYNTSLEEKRPTLSGLWINLEGMTEGDVDGYRVALIPLDNLGLTGPTLAGLVFSLTDSGIVYVGTVNSEDPLIDNGHLFSVRRHYEPGECMQCFKTFDVVPYSIKNGSLIKGPLRPSISREAWLSVHARQPVRPFHLFHLARLSKRAPQSTDVLVQIESVTPELTGFLVSGRDNHGQTRTAHLAFSAKPLLHVGTRLRLQTIVLPTSLNSLEVDYSATVDDQAVLTAIEQSTLESTLRLFPSDVAQIVRHFNMVTIGNKRVFLQPTNPGREFSSFSDTIKLPPGYKVTVAVNRCAYPGCSSASSFAVLRLATPNPGKPPVLVRPAFKGFQRDTRFTRMLLLNFYGVAAADDFTENLPPYFKAHYPGETEIVKGRLYTYEIFDGIDTLSVLH